MNFKNTDRGGTDLPFPRRLPLEGFPDQPSEGASKPPMTVANVAHMLAETSITVRFNVIKKRLLFTRQGEEITQGQIIGLANMNGLAGGWLLDFIREIGEDNPVNPVADWIDSVPWDGADRTEAFYATVTVDEDFPVGLRNLLLHRWMLSAVAAALTPVRFKARGVLTFQGAQGIGKTSWIAALVPPDLRNDFVLLDHHLDAGNKDSILNGVSHWLVEIGELDSSFRKDVARLKGFLTNDCDKLRPPYERTAIEMPRRTVFAATVNDAHFLVDQTGNSRWWTLPVISLNCQHGIDMQQLFAQLAVQYRNGAQWWLKPDEERQLEDHNQRFRAVSAIELRLLEKLDPDGRKARYMTAIAVLRDIGITSPSNQQCRECGAILRQHFGPPKRVQGRDQWKVPLRSPDEGFVRYDPEANTY